MSSFWADACSNEESKSLQDRLYASHWSCGTTVLRYFRRRRLYICLVARCSCVMRFCEQIAAYCVSAVASGVMFYRWLKLGEEERQLVWRLYGWFSGLMLCGSCVGTVTWAAWMQVIVNEFTGVREENISGSQRFFHWSLSDRWNGGFKVTYAIEFLCLSLAKLLVLDRLSKFASAGMTLSRWVVSKRVVLAAVITGNLVGLAGNIAAAVQYDRRADLLMTISTDLAADNVPANYPKWVEIADQLQLVLALSSVQLFCEVAVLLLIVLAFIVVGIACVKRVSSGISVLEISGPEIAANMHIRPQAVEEAMALARQIRKQVAVTTGIVFVTFLIRSAYSTMYAVAFQLQEFSNIARKCPGSSVCDATCFNVYTHIYFWMMRTPVLLLLLFHHRNPPLTSAQVRPSFSS